jgi:galactokinase
MEDLIARHERTYGRKPEVIADAPGCVNLIGELSDYNEGFVLPIAVGYRLEVAMSRRHDTALRFYSMDYDDLRRTSVVHNRFRREDRWANYAKGVVRAFVSEGYRIGGLDCTVRGNIPQGVGLASSGALEVATALALRQLFELDVDALDLVCLAQKAETVFIGRPSSIMDQIASAYSSSGNGLLIDTRSLDYRPVPVTLDGFALVVTNSNIAMEFDTLEFETRRAEATACVDCLNRQKPGRTLRDFSAEDVLDTMGAVPERTRKHCLHVVEENERVIEVTEALQRNDMESVGKILAKSHESLRDLYEATCPELDWLVKRAGEIEGVHGSRMVGAGFGGCTISVMDEDVVDAYLENIEAYERIFGFKAESYVVAPSGGAHILRSGVVSA